MAVGPRPRTRPAPRSASGAARPTPAAGLWCAKAGSMARTASFHKPSRLRIHRVDGSTTLWRVGDLLISSQLSSARLRVPHVLAVARTLRRSRRHAGTLGRARHAEPAVERAPACSRTTPRCEAAARIAELRCARVGELVLLSQPSSARQLVPEGLAVARPLRASQRYAVRAWASLPCRASRRARASFFQKFSLLRGRCADRSATLHAPGRHFHIDLARRGARDRFVTTYIMKDQVRLVH